MVCRWLAVGMMNCFRSASSAARIPCIPRSGAKTMATRCLPGLQRALWCRSALSGAQSARTAPLLPWIGASVQQKGARPRVRVLSSAASQPYWDDDSKARVNVYNDYTIYKVRAGAYVLAGACESDGGKRRQRRHTRQSPKPCTCCPTRCRAKLPWGLRSSGPHGSVWAAGWPLRGRARCCWSLPMQLGRRSTTGSRKW